MSSPSSVQVKYGALTHTVDVDGAVTVDALKLSLGAATALKPSEMKLLARGKVLGEGQVVAAGTKLLLMRAAAAQVTLRVREIVSGRAAPPFDVPATASHSHIVSTALRKLGCPDGADSLIVRMFLPHANVLMRSDLTLSDYASSISSGTADVLIVPCSRGSSPEEASDEAILAAARAEVANAVLARAHYEAEMEVQLEAESLRAASLTLPPSIVDEAEAEGESAAREAEKTTAGGASSAASLVPQRLRTGLMPSMDAVRVISIPPEVVAEMEAYEAYDAELNALRELVQRPSEEAKELLAAAEEARLEDRCVALASSLADADGAPYDEPTSSPPQRPPTPVRGRRTEGSRWSEAAASPRTSSLLGRHLRARSDDSPRRRPVELSVCHSFGGVSLSGSGSSAECMACFDEASIEATMEGWVEEGVERVRGRWEDDGLLDPPVLRHSEKVSDALPMPKAKAQKVCKVCRCRLPLTAIAASACKCGDVFCAKHMHAHECQHDFRSQERRKLQDANPKIEPSKLERL